MTWAKKKFSEQQPNRPTIFAIFGYFGWKDTLLHFSRGSRKLVFFCISSMVFWLWAHLETGSTERRPLFFNLKNELCFLTNNSNKHQQSHASYLTIAV